MKFPTLFFLSLLLLWACSSEKAESPPPASSSSAATEAVEGKQKTNIDWDAFFEEQAKEQTKKTAKPAPKPSVLTKMVFKPKGEYPIPVYDTFAEMEHLFNVKNDTTYVINFWATWCKPCVEELPYFERLHKKYSKQKVRVVLVSLDFKGLIPHKLVPFMQKNPLASDVVLLADPKASSWVDKVDTTWDGAIPVTLIYKANKRKFVGYQVANFQDLERQLKKVL